MKDRKNLVFKVILYGTILLLAWGNIYIFQVVPLEGVSRDGLHEKVMFLILLYFIFLFAIYKRGHVKTASFLMIAAYFVMTAYCSFRWGVSLPATLLGYTLIITISSILLGNLSGFIMTAIIFIAMMIAGYLESTAGIIPPWKGHVVDMRDIIFYSIILFIIMLVSWLSNRETEYSLKRALISERELEKEKESLEIKVAERTEELKRVQAERVSELYHFAEFGRLSSGLFHDLMNPLTSVSLNIESLEDSLHRELPEIKANLAHSIQASRKMERFILAVKRQISRRSFEENFLINSIIGDVRLLLNHKTMKAGVALELDMKEDINTCHNPLEFQQVITNLISNAIDSHEGSENNQKKVNIRLALERSTPNIVRIEISDNGCGIPAALKEKIFDPFFSTKHHHKGMGLGLSTTKRIIEKSFTGTLEMHSKENVGTRFVISFPQKSS